MRMLLFQLIFILSYLKIRNSKIIRINYKHFKFKKAFFILFSLILLASYFLLFIFSGDFDGYLESYERYNHLSRPLRLFISVIVRFKFAFIILFLIHFFIYFRDKKKIITIGFLLLMFLEAKYSAGARISVLFLLFTAFSLYVILNGLPKIRILLVGILISFVLFSIVEKTRANDNDFVDKELAQLIPGEFGSAFFTSFHLYQERDDNQLPKKSYKMLFFDFIAPFIPNAEVVDIDPIFWYRNNYFPTAKVPPFTIGPIANTAIWEGEIGLIFRSWLCALIFAKFSNFITRRNISPFKLFIYLSVFSTSIMVIKYSIFFQLTLIFKNLIVPFILFLIIRNVLENFIKNPLTQKI